jgi:hypothetical protein
VGACSASSCSYACQVGFGDCNGTRPDGCEINTNTDVANCGTCGSVCARANAVPTCASGACRVSRCNAGFADCNGNEADGCERAVSADTSNCGGCGVVCSVGQTCVSGACFGRTCDPSTEVSFQGRCFYLDGSAGTCLAGYSLAPESILTQIEASFVGKNYRTRVSNNCCITTSDPLQNFGMAAHCNSAGPFTAGDPSRGAALCTGQQIRSSSQLTFCGSN